MKKTLFLLLVFGCNTQNELSLKEQKFQENLVKAYVEIEVSRRSDPTQPKESYYKILEKHEISKTDFEKEVEKLRENPEQFTVFLDSLLAVLTRLEGKK
ncbi:hypothetical protein IT568_12935 [bacterium]|nr:hypothetical protein [bacterium]